MSEVTLRLSIVGAGRVGQTLGKLLFDANACDVAQVFSRGGAAASQAVHFIGTGKPILSLSEFDLSPENGADVLLIAVPDDAIEPIAKQIAELHTDLSGITVLHCSGSMTADALRPLQILGAGTASVHPIKSFSDPATAVRTFVGTYCSVETGQAGSRSILTDLFRRIGGETFDLASDVKPLYHTAIVLVCNYLYTLLHMGLETLEAAGIAGEIAMAAIEPIMHETVTNGVRLGPGKALTGPIVRGDINTIVKQISQLNEHLPQFSDAYRELGKVTAQLARADATLSGESFAAIVAALDDRD